MEDIALLDNFDYTQEVIITTTVIMFIQESLMIQFVNSNRVTEDFIMIHFKGYWLVVQQLELQFHLNNIYQLLNLANLATLHRATILTIATERVFNREMEQFEVSLKFLIQIYYHQGMSVQDQNLYPLNQDQHVLLPHSIRFVHLDQYFQCLIHFLYLFYLIFLNYQEYFHSHLVLIHDLKE